jgi:hypothetical protein
MIFKMMGRQKGILVLFGFFFYLPLVVECWDFSFWVTPTQSLTKQQGRTTMAQERIRAVLGF